MSDVFDAEFIQQAEALYPDAKPYRAQRSGVVYFIQEGDDGPVKIGWAQSVERRLASMQTGNPRPLVTRAVIATRRRALERETHQRFVSERMSGEWFRPSVALLSYIVSLQEQPEF